MSACTSHDMPRCRHSLATKNGKCLVTALPRSVLYASRKVWTACPRRASQGFEPGVTRIVQKKLGSIRARNASVEAFLQAYESCRGAEAMKHVPLFRAAKCLHRVHRELYMCKTPIPEWASIMLNEGLKALP